MAQSAQESRLAAIGEAAARVLRRTDYEAVRAEDVAAEVRLPSTGDGRRDRLQTRSTPWFYNETRKRRVWVALGAFYAWQQFLAKPSAEELHTPESTIEARANLVTALKNIAEFHQSQNRLMKQVARGIGDISTSEKRKSSAVPSRIQNQRDPEWSDGPWGKVARGGWNFACVAFSDYLMPIIRSSLEAVTYLGEDEIERQANLLSDLAFRVYTTDLESRPDHLPDGLAAYWFEGNLVDAAGEWVHDLEMIERRLRRLLRGVSVPTASFQAEATARAALISFFIGEDTLYRRCMDQGSIMKRRYETAISGEGRVSTKEAEIFCDITSRSGLSLLRWGDYANAVSAFKLSSQIAENYLGADPSRVARSQVNLGDAYCQLGDLPSAIRSADQALTSRTNIADKEGNPGGQSSEWRRLTIAQKTRAVIAYRAGQVVDGVQRAMRLVEDRRSKLSPEHLDTADACAVLGEALLEAGHPLRAGQTVREAHEIKTKGKKNRPAVTSYGIQNDLLLLSRIELTLNNPAGAVKLLEGAPILTDWFAERVSFRLSYEARRYYAVGVAESLGHDRGISELESGINALTENHNLSPVDPLVQRYQRNVAQILLHSGATVQARSILADIDEHETERGRLCLPAHAGTLLLLAQTSIGMGDRPAAKNYLRRLYSLVSDGIDASHPTILAGYYEDAMLHLAAGEIPAARDLLGVVLDNRLLSHGLPALGVGHRLLVAAWREAPKVGLEVRQEDDNRLWTEW